MKHAAALLALAATIAVAGCAPHAATPAAAAATPTPTLDATAPVAPAAQQESPEAVPRDGGGADRYAPIAGETDTDAHLIPDNAANPPDPIAVRAETMVGPAPTYTTNPVITIRAVVEGGVTITSITPNRGHCGLYPYNPKLPVTLEFGEEVAVDAKCDSMLEVEVETDAGTYAFEFDQARA